MIFQQKYASTRSCARIGTLTLPHGNVETPAFMPVGTNGTVKAISHSDLDEMGVRLILGNTYHLYLRPGTTVIERAGGLHGFSTWPHNILTDSGGYQLFSLSEFRKISTEGVRFRSHIDGSYHEFTPEKVIDIQRILGSDVCMPLDVCTPPEIDYKEAESALQITVDWLKRSQHAWEDARDRWNGSLFGIVQGNFFEDLRRRAALETAELGLPGIAIGGLSVGEDWEKFLHFLNFTSGLLPVEKPKYVMGIGTPEYILAAVSAGIDIFDCVFPTRTARTGMVFTKAGTLNLKKEYNAQVFEPIDTSCGCPVCRRYTRAYMRHLFKANEILGIMLATRHNLEFLEHLMRETRENIANGTFERFKRSFLDTYTAGQTDQ